jgi:type II secretory pathway pseudopilin PulG
MLSAIRRRLAADRGFTLIELLVTITLAMVVLAALTRLIDTSGRANARLTDKTETVQRMRFGMDRVSRVLRTQVCLNSSTPPLVGGDASSVTFYSDTSSNAEFRPSKVRLFIDGAAIKQETWTLPAAVTNPTSASYTDASVTKVIVANIAIDGSTPFLRFYSFEDIDDADDVAVPLDPSVTADPLPANSIAKVVRIAVAFQAQPESGRTTTGRTTAMNDSIYTRNADFSGGPDTGRTWGPRCG